MLSTVASQWHERLPALDVHDTQCAGHVWVHLDRVTIRTLVHLAMSSTL